MEIEGRLYITCKDAADRAGYTTDHVARLCRQNIVRTYRNGKKWYILEEDFNAFLGKNGFEKTTKNIDLSEKRVKEFKIEQIKRIADEPDNDLSLEARDMADYFLSHVAAAIAATSVYLREQLPPILSMHLKSGLRYHLKFEPILTFFVFITFVSVSTYVAYLLSIYTAVVQASL